jgi:hypothetical protein
MLKVIIFTGDLDSRNPGRQLAVLDIAYAKKNYLSHYAVAMSLRGEGELQPDLIANYPRWSASLWDLVARGLTRILYRSDVAPELAEPDRRCAYATRLCAVIEKSSLTERGIELGTVEMSQDAGKRGRYTARVTEDILGPREAHFEYGLKSLNPADLLLRAICFALYGKSTIGPVPKLITPPTLKVDGGDHFHIESLVEPAKTGFLRYCATVTKGSTPLNPMPPAKDYVSFLIES